MSIEVKQNTIKEYSEAALAALDNQINTIKNLIDNYDLLNEEDRISYAKSKEDLAETLERNEKVRAKLIQNDFNLSLFEINVVALAFYYQEQVLSRQQQALNSLIFKTHNLVQILMAKEEVE